MVLASIGVILCEERGTLGELTEQELEEINGSSLSIFQEWIDFDHQRSLTNIMKDGDIAHDQDLFVRFLTSLKNTSQVAE